MSDDKMSDLDKPLPNDAPNVMLTIRMIMNGKEVGSIIGKGGEIINNIREESGAKIHISDGSVPERIVTVTGSTDAIYKSFSMICKKFEDDGPNKDEERSSSSSSSNGVPRPPVTLRLIVPASQCGSLIGKGGSKIKEIREVTGASIQVASEMLPNSTERAVTISGSSKAITQCIYNICCVMLESPPKGTTIPYTPKGNMSGAGGLLGASGALSARGSRGAGMQENPLASLLGLGGQASTLAAIASLAGSQIREGRSRSDRDDGGRGGGGSDERTSTHEMSIPNDMIGCIIGKGGSKIAEIRQLSGAMIRISKSDEADRDNDSAERAISITGNADSVALAKSLINMSLDLHKSKMDEQARDEREGGGSRSNDRGSGSRDRDRYSGSGGHSGAGAMGAGGLASLAALGGLGGAAGANLGLAQLLAKPEALTALTTLASFSGLGGLGGAGGLLAGLGGAGVGGAGGHHGAGSGTHHGGGGSGGHVTGVHRSRGGYGGSSRSSRDDDRGRDSKRSKFAPY